MLQTIELNPSTAAQASVIWLHGLGADGHDFTGIIPELGIQDQLAIRFIFPHAPQRPVTINGGYVMRAWYDISAQDLTRGQDSNGIKQSEQQIIELIDQEIERGITADKIVLAGFSQGGAIALYTGLKYPQQLAGILAMSTYLPLMDEIINDRSPQNQTTPIMMAHGQNDTIIPISQGQQSFEKLKTLGYTTQWHDYVMEHSVCLHEVKDIAQWLNKILTTNYVAV